MQLKRAISSSSYDEEEDRTEAKTLGEREDLTVTVKLLY